MSFSHEVQVTIIIPNCPIKKFSPLFGANWVGKRERIKDRRLVMSLNHTSGPGKLVEFAQTDSSKKKKKTIDKFTNDSEVFF
jgi:hypothetical protein